MKRLQVSALLLLTITVSLALPQCAPKYKPGLPPGSPFAGEAPEPAVIFPQGVATGDVMSGSALIWFRTVEPANVQVEWMPEDETLGSAPTTDQPSPPRRSEIVRTTPADDLTATLLLQGLAPATRYRYRVFLAGEWGGGTLPPSVSGQFTTPPSSEKPELVTFVWSGDLGGQQRCRRGSAGYPIFDQMLRVRPAFALLVGDLIYSDDRCPSPPNAPGADFLAASLDGYRAKHRYQREAPALQRFLAAVPVYPIWDDHEVRDNFSGQSEPLMPIGRQAFLEYWPIQRSYGDPHRLYRKIRRGSDLELFILDTRQYRSPNSEPDGPQKTMLGQAQREWLLGELGRSTATWKVIVTSVPLSIPKSGTHPRPGIDSWTRGPDGTGFQSELRTIISWIVEHKIRNIVWLAADVHYAQVNAYDPDKDGRVDFHEFICGPLSAAPGRVAAPDSFFHPTTLYSDGGFLNFGAVTINGRTLRLEIIDEAGAVRFAHAFEAAGGL